MSQNSQKNRSTKLSLKKNRLKLKDTTEKHNRSSDLIIIDESFDKLRSNLTKNLQVRSPLEIYSPIVINDSSELSHNADATPQTTIMAKSPSKSGNLQVRSPLEIHSPIVINDSSELSHNADATPQTTIMAKSPSKSGNMSRVKMDAPPYKTSVHKCGQTEQHLNIKLLQHALKSTFIGANLDILKENRRVVAEITTWPLIMPFGRIKVSFNGSQLETSRAEARESRPSAGGWSPAQGILCATPRNLPVPTTPKDTADESQKYCTMQKIQQSHKKLLNDLYGEVWKTIPRLFKDQAKTDSNMAGVTKKLNFNEDDDSDKENNIRKYIRKNKELYLTNSDAKRRAQELSDMERKSKKKLYTEKVPMTPEPTAPKVKVKRDVNSTTKKIKVTGKSVTEIVETMKDKFASSTVGKGFGDFSGTPRNDEIKRLSFMGSLADNVPSWRCHPEAFEYKDHYKTTREKLTRRLFVDFNRNVFGDQLDADMVVSWDSKLRSTAGTTTNRLTKQSNGDRVRSSSVKLSIKVLDAPQRLRDTLIHELCHAATWVVDQELRAGHGPLWKKWASRALKVYPELGEISRCHNLEIHFKYSYKCTKCGYTIKRHSKSVDITKKCCGYCRGTFELILNRKTKDGVVVSTPARQGEVNEFAKYVKENYGSEKKGKSHAQVMQVLGEQFSAKKKRLGEIS